MKPPMWLRAAVTLLCTVILLSCQALKSPTPSAGTKFYTAADVARMFPVIRMSKNDGMTYGTACQVVEHDVAHWCLGVGDAPAAFDPKWCLPQTDVCRQILGDPPAARADAGPSA